jgi:hypothetical protein
MSLEDMILYLNFVKSLNNEYESGNILRLKFKAGLRSEYCDNTKDGGKGKTAKRTKERKIGFIIEKVSLWRKLYNGIREVKIRKISSLFCQKLTIFS